MVNRRSGEDQFESCDRQDDRQQLLDEARRELATTEIRADRTSEHAAASNGNANVGSCFVLLRLPRSPEIELTRMNRAETAEAVFVLAHRIKISKGVRKIRPPFQSILKAAQVLHNGNGYRF